MGKKLAAAEALGEQGMAWKRVGSSMCQWLTVLLVPGKVEESLKLMAEVEGLKGQRAEAEVRHGSKHAQAGCHRANWVPLG
jgi:hypothetical protein